MPLSGSLEWVEGFLRDDVWSPVQASWSRISEKIDTHDVSFSRVHQRFDSFFRNDVWPSLHSGWATAIDAMVGAKMLAKNSWMSVAAWIEHVREHPPIYRKHLGDDNSTEIFVRLPYVGPVTLDVFVFGASAVMFRIYMFWRARRQTFGGGKGYTLGRGNGSSPSPIAKAKHVNDPRFKDPSLQQTMQECESVKSKLRKVQDPELARREKRKHLKLNNMKSGKGVFLGMAEDNLQRARRHLKQVNPSSNDDKLEVDRRPLQSKNS